MVEIACHVCGKATPKTCAKKRFCSRKCSKRHEHSKRPKVGLVSTPGACIGCQSPLPVPRVCSRLKCARCSKYGTPEQRRRQDRRKTIRNAERRLTDASFTMRKRLSCRLRELCSKRGIQKRNSITAYLGCTPKELIGHLESKFLPGMNWQNYGRDGWHVDHHIPCAAFDLTREDHRAVLFHHSNLRPLWAMDNAKKQATLHNDIPAALKDFALRVGVLVL